MGVGVVVTFISQALGGIESSRSCETNKPLVAEGFSCFWREKSEGLPGISERYSEKREVSWRPCKGCSLRGMGVGCFSLCQGKPPHTRLPSGGLHFTWATRDGPASEK